MWGYGCCFVSQTQSCFREPCRQGSMLAHSPIDPPSRRPRITTPAFIRCDSVMDRSVCFRPSSESELRNVSGSLHRLGTRFKNLEFFLKRSTRFLHYWNEWKRPRNCDLISPQKSRLGRPLATGGKTWVPSDRRNRTGNRFRRSSGFLTAILPFSSPLLVFASS